MTFGRIAIVSKLGPSFTFIEKETDMADTPPPRAEMAAGGVVSVRLPPSPPALGQLMTPTECATSSPLQTLTLTELTSNPRNR